MHFSVFFILLISVSCSRISPNPEPGELRQELSIQSSGINRSFIVRLPDNYNPDKTDYPLIIAMHGFGGSGSQVERNYFLAEKALPRGYIVVFPDGTPVDNLPLRYWSVGISFDKGTSMPDDVKFISDLIDYMNDKFNVDTKRVFATGMSNGAIMSYKLANELSSKITAIAPVAGTMLPGTRSPENPVPVIHFHSLLDTSIPFDGGAGFGGFTFPPVENGLSKISTVNGCGSIKVSEQDKGMYLVKEWGNCEQIPVILYLTKDGGHSWPRSEKPRVGADDVSDAIDANELMLDFFDKLSR
jgi:polyhydroxybutyrate depolymerase